MALKLYNNVARILKEKGYDDPLWFMATQIALPEMENMKIRELTELFYHGTDAIKETSKEDFEKWCLCEAETWEMNVWDWLEEATRGLGI